MYNVTIETVRNRRRHVHANLGSELQSELLLTTNCPTNQVSDSWSELSGSLRRSKRCGRDTGGKNRPQTVLFRQLHTLCM